MDVFNFAKLRRAQELLAAQEIKDFGGAWFNGVPVFAGDPTPRSAQESVDRFVGQVDKRTPTVAVPKIRPM